MKRIILISIGFCFALISNAQTIKNNVIASGGTILKSGNIQLEYTVGETMTNTLSSSSNKITQGFHQPNIVVARIANSELPETNVETNSSTEKIANELSLNVFPNPTTDFVNIESTSDEQIELKLIDASGKIVEQLKLQSSTQIDFTKYVAGTYFLVATTEDGKTRNTFKVMKQK